VQRRPGRIRRILLTAGKEARSPKLAEGEERARSRGELVDAVEEVLHLQQLWRWPMPAYERRGWSHLVLDARQAGEQVGGHGEGVGSVGGRRRAAMQGRGSWAGGRKWMDRMRAGWERAGRRRSAGSGPNFLSKFKAILIFRGQASIITAAFAACQPRHDGDCVHVKDLALAGWINIYTVR
jgi:hypothetical protein